MKKNLKRVIAVLAAVIISFASCGPLEDFDEELLYGKWYCSSMGLYYTFNSNGSGRYQDSNGDGKNFDWSLYGDELEIEIHADSDEFDITAYETYIITALDGSTMTCYEEGHKSTTYTFVKK